VVAEGRRRLETWAVLVEKVPSLTAVVTLAAAPASDPVLTRDEWALLSLVDGSRSVADLVSLSGTGEYVVVSALAGLAERGLVLVGEPLPGLSALVQRHQLLAALEGRPGDAEPAPPEVAAVPEASFSERQPVIPERLEPFTTNRQPAHAEEPMPALARLVGSAARSGTSVSVSSSPAGGVGAVQGAHALAADPVPAAHSYIDRDPSVNKSLLLRLIAGVRGL
jgi:hypothetical protein